LRRTDVVTYTWGDEGSGEVQDWIYVSSEKIHQLVFGLPPGGVFRHSDEFRTIFAADEVLYVEARVMQRGGDDGQRRACAGRRRRIRPRDHPQARRERSATACNGGADAARSLAHRALQERHVPIVVELHHGSAGTSSARCMEVSTHDPLLPAGRLAHAGERASGLLIGR
jgi:hypothetical protein